VKTLTWHYCYDQGWSGLIAPDSFKHPAKMSKALLERILDHLLDRGWIARGDTIGDPFGGVGTTGLLAAYRGLRCLSVELEPKFVSLARRNYALHTGKWKRLGAPRPVILQGDSRRFDELVGPLAGLCCSPPYAAIAAGAGGLNSKPARQPGQQSGRAADSASQSADQKYGQAAGQISRLADGSIEAVVSSPPYADSLRAQKDGIDWEKAKQNGELGKNHGKGVSCHAEYGQTPGQIGQLKGVSLSALCTSPPYADSVNSQQHGIDWSKVDPKSTGGRKRGPGSKHAQTLTSQLAYGETPGQIGREKPETYWQAMAQVYAACFRALKPGAVIAVVVKSYVKAGKIVDLPAGTLKLLLHLGFLPLERAQAMLTRQTLEPDLFAGHVTKAKSRKSFFRRLSEAKGSPPIDYEIVLFCQKPL